MKEKKIECPGCGSENIAEIVQEFKMEPEFMKKLAAGKVKVSACKYDACAVDKFHCNDCGKEFD